MTTRELIVMYVTADNETIRKIAVEALKTKKCFLF